MVFFIRAVRISIYNFKMTISSIRVLAVLILIALFIARNLEPVLEFSNIVKIGVTPYAFPFLTNDFICQLVMMAGAVFIFSNAPFEDDGHLYRLSRSGRFSWGLGQVFYIIGMSFLYVLFLILISTLPLAGHLELDDKWGKIWETLAKTDAGVQVKLLLHVTEYMVNHNSAAAAMAKSWLLEWGCVSWLGLLIYLLNKFSGKALGTCTGAFFVLLDICISNDWMNWANRFSPITLAQINTYSGYNLQYHITLTYGILFFITGIIALGILCILANYREHPESWCLMPERKWRQMQ